MASDDNTRKIGEGHAAAMARLGLRELRAAMYPSGNVAQQSEYGLYGTLTPGEVAESRRNDGRDLEEDVNRDSDLDDRSHQAMDRDDRDDDSRDLERE
jgi:hypothetical protein